MGVSRKQSTSNFPKNKHFLPPDTHTYVCLSGDKKCSFFGKFGVPRFLETPVLRLAFLPYYRRTFQGKPPSTIFTFIQKPPQKDSIVLIHKRLLNPFQFSVTFHIETSHFFGRAKQVNGFYMKRNTGLKSVN